MGTTDKKKVLVADDHRMFRQGLITQIQNDGAFEIAGEAANGEEAFDLIKELRPDIALLDINMPEMSGLEIARESIKEGVQTDFIILTMYKEEQYFNKAMDIGVKGYLLKENSYEDLLSCLKTVAAGRPFISPLLSEYMVSRHAKMTSLEESAPALKLLTPTEKRIMKLIAEYKTSREIAEELFISHRTEENHRANICRKLDIKGMNKLLQFALEHQSLLEKN